METKPPGNLCPIDVTDEEWAFVAPYLTLITSEAPHRRHELRDLYFKRGYADVDDDGPFRLRPLFAIWARRWSDEKRINRRGTWWRGAATFSTSTYFPASAFPERTLMHCCDRASSWGCTVSVAKNFRWP